MLKRLISITNVSCERGLAFRGEDRQLWSVENGNYFGTLYIYIPPCPAHPVARKARKPSLQTMCPQRTSDAELTISLLLTSLSVNLIDLTMKPSGRVCGNRLLKQI